MAAQNSNEIPDGMDFEQAFTRLGEVVQGLEIGGLPLNDATQLYEEGVFLAQICSRLLHRAELKVTDLKKSYADFSTEPPMDSHR